MRQMHVRKKRWPRLMKRTEKRRHGKTKEEYEGDEETMRTMCTFPGNMRNCIRWSENYTVCGYRK